MLAGLVVFIAAHAFGQGSVIWVFISEIFPNRIRGRGQSLGSLTHWVFAAVVSYAFPAYRRGARRRHGVHPVLPVHDRPADLGAEGHAGDAGVPLEEMERELGIELSEDDISGAQSGPRSH